MKNLPRERNLALRLRVVRRGACGDGPVVESSSGKAPIVRGSDAVIIIDLHDLRRVFDDFTPRSDKIGEDVISRAMPPRSPFDRDPVLPKSTNSSHDGINIRCFECDVIEADRGVLHQGNAVMICARTQEGHQLRFIDYPEIHGFTVIRGRRRPIRRVHHHVGHFLRFVGIAQGGGLAVVIRKDAYGAALGILECKTISAVGL